MNTGMLIAEVKALKTENPNGEFEAILSAPTKDREGAVVAARALEPLPPSIPIYNQHDWTEKALPVGRGEPYYEGDVLKVKGYFASTERGQEMRALVNEGIVHAMSVGFLYEPVAKKSIDGVMTTTKGDLVEGSFTAVPINRDSLILASKALEAKAGARHSKTDREHLDTIAASLNALGWECPGCAAGATKSLEDAETKSEAPAANTDPVEQAGAVKAPADPPAEVDEALMDATVRFHRIRIKAHHAVA